MVMVKKEMDYKAKIALCEKLGAKQMQKFVFLVEKCKYKLLKSICPNYLKWYDKYDNFRLKRELKKYHSNVTKKRISIEYQKHRFLVHKQFYLSRNVNYHMNKNKPMEFIKYLEWNKEIHKQGLKVNFVVMPVATLLSFFGLSTITIPFLIYNILSCFINLECINIQNYNIYRFKEKENTLREYAERVNKRNVEKYGAAMECITENLNKGEVPSAIEITHNMKTKEQLQQLRAMAQEILKQRAQLEDATCHNQKIKSR